MQGITAGREQPSRLAMCGKSGGGHTSHAGSHCPPYTLTDTTCLNPASSSDSLSISPSTMMISLHPAMSSRPYSTFSAPLTCGRAGGWVGQRMNGPVCPAGKPTEQTCVVLLFSQECHRPPRCCLTPSSRP